MSHSNGAVKFPDGTIKFYEYDGTVDMCIPILYDTTEELRANWRRKDYWKQCTCEPPFENHTRVKIASSYGGGFYWDGFACKRCNCLISPLDVNYDTHHNGLPDWFPNREAYGNHAL